MSNFKQQFEIIYDKFVKMAAEKNSQTTLNAFARLLGISHSKVYAWQKGQWPSAEDCTRIEKLFNFNLRWLVTGEGDPEGQDAPATIDQATLQPQAKAIPLVGFASCGVQSLDQIMPFAVSATPPQVGPRTVAVIANGDSLVPAGIASGQVCYCDPDQSPLAGDVVYVAQNDDKGTLKVFLERTATTIKLKGWLPLNSENQRKAFEMEILAETIKTVAPVVLVRRRL